MNERTTSTSLNALAAEIHRDNCNAGWWGYPDGCDLKSNPLVFPAKLALVHSELSEALEGHRKGLQDDHLPHRKSVEVEFADALIRLLDLAEASGMDLDGAVAEKRAYNKARADHKPAARAAAHGKSY